MTKEIKLTQGFSTLVSDEDYEWLNETKWQYHKGYARRTQTINGVKKNFLMSRQIMGFPVGLQVEHADRQPLNNTRENLRIATQSQNNANRTKQANNPGNFKGVFRHKRSPNFQASIGFEGKTIYLGMFKCEKEAARAYNKKALELYPDFIHLNVID